MAHGKAYKGLRWRDAALILCLMVPLGVAAGQDEGSRAPTGLPALTDLASLPLLRTGTWLVGTDSHDVTGGNNDGFGGLYSYLYKDGEEYVLFEEAGPGCVYVTRTIGFKGNLNIYLNEAAKPQYTYSFADIYLGRKPPFITPLVAPEQTAHGSSWSYVPISFADGCKLTTDEMGRNHFFNIVAHKYAQGTDVISFEDRLSVEAAARAWSRPSEPPTAADDVEEVRDTVQLAPRQPTTILAVDGPGTVWSLKLRFPDATSEGAGTVVVRAYWDGRPIPQVDSPVSSFFGLGCRRALAALNWMQHHQSTVPHRVQPGATDPRSLVIGKDEEGWLYCYFPMPFWQSARIQLVNCSCSDIVRLEYAVRCSPHVYPRNSGYFCARWRQENPVPIGEDYTVLETRGHGHFVGCVLTMSSVHAQSPTGKGTGRGHLEGDARLYIDGSRTPVVAGTGTEEYFNWGWYDILPHDSVFSYATHGYPVHALDDQDHTVMYRFHLSDLVPYYRSFRFDLEHGGIGHIPANYSGTAFFYERDEPVLVLADELDVGDGESEREHLYSVKGTVWRGRRTLPYEGSHQLTISRDSPRDREHAVRDDGRAWTKSCTFQVGIDPKNAGVKIRRRSFYGFGGTDDLAGARKKPGFIPRQRVAVTVDDMQVGEWHLPPRRARDTWLDTDFEVPAASTRQKERITITLTNRSDSPWDEYTYWVYTYRDTVD